MEDTEVVGHQNTKAYMFYVYKGHKECRGFPLWRANSCRTQLYLKGGVAAGQKYSEGFWRHRKNMNRHVICKHREIAAPVHVKEGGAHHRHFGNKGGVEKGKVRPTGSGSAKVARGKRLD